MAHPRPLLSTYGIISRVALPKNDGANPLRDDFRKFLFVTWKHLNLPDPTPVQYDIGKFIQTGPRRKMVMAFRGVGKSWIYAAYVCWVLYCDPDKKILVVSASKPLADDFSKFVKRLISEMPLLRHLRPKDGQRDTNISFDVGPAAASKDPSVKSVGITGQITGSRADLILADDIESLNNSSTELSRERLAEAIREFDAVLKPKGVITYLGTPQSFMSMYNKLPERGYTIRIWPARVPENVEDYRGLLADYVHRLVRDGVVPGTPVDPDRFDDTDLAEREASYGRSGFMLQFMLNTADADLTRFPLKLADLVTMSLDRQLGPTKVAWGKSPEQTVEGIHNFGLPGDRYYRPFFISDTMVEYTGTVMAIDPSGRGKDETGYAIVKHLHGQLFLVASGGFKDGYADSVLEALAKLAVYNSAQKILIEGNFGGGMFAKLLQPHLARQKHLCSIEEVTSSGQKEARILDTLEPLLAQHRLIVDTDLINKDYESTQAEQQYALFYQMTRLTRDRGSLAQDDRLDALAMACTYWAEQMAQDVDTAVSKERSRAVDRELREFMQNAIGYRPKRKRWMV